MSETDARMSFERHATSKIKDANDLFAIRTLGFRGEALASIAAIAQVEMKTRRHEDDTSSTLVIEGSYVVSQEPSAGSPGTSIAVKNLFFNIPARRKFLKSDTTELRHIIEEFQRVALVRPGIKFTFYNDGKQLFNLNPGNLKQRIVSLFGSGFNNKLLPVEQESEVVSISGFIGKPEFARKTRGEQYFFVNGRFIRHPYLNHALENTFRELIPSDAFPSYFIHFKVDPGEIDINIHPTKTEINFQNNQVIYAMLSSAVKQSLGKFNIVPSLDFDSDSFFNITLPPKEKTFGTPQVKVNTDFNPFSNSNRSANVTPGFKHGETIPPNREKMYNREEESEYRREDQLNMKITDDGEENRGNVFFQLQGDIIITLVKSGLMVIHPQRALERIMFEECLLALESGNGMSQQHLFPQTIQLSTVDAEILKGLRDELRLMGFEIDDFGNNAFIVNGSPAEIDAGDVKDLLDGMIENVKRNIADIKIDKKVSLARSMAVNMAFRHKTRFKAEEIKSLINRLFATKVPELSPDGKPVVRIISSDEIRQKF
jgi:DNA mismatch repair protein MutL